MHKDINSYCKIINAILNNWDNNNENIIGLIMLYN